jgi:hypothetical protein
MPYTPQELEDHEFYSSLKQRDEVAYELEYQKMKNKFEARELEANPTLSEAQVNKISIRNKNDVVQLYESPQTGETYISNNQKIYVNIYQRRYRSKKDTIDFIDRDFKEF